MSSKFLVQTENMRAGASRLSSFFLLLFTILTLSVASFPLLSHAQDDGDSAPVPERRSESSSPNRAHHVVGGSFGHTILFGDWGNYYDDGFSYSGFYAYEATPIFGFMMNVSYGYFTGGGNDHLTMWAIEPDLKINLFYFDNVVFAAFGGFGLYPVSQKIGISDGSVLGFGMNLGFSVDLHLGDHFTFGPGIQFRSVFNKKDASVQNSSFPAGMNIGGETIRLFLQAGYVF
jgi:hypothetical protein